MERNNKSATRQGCCLRCYDLNIIYYDVDIIDVVVFFFIFLPFFLFFPKGTAKAHGPPLLVMLSRVLLRLDSSVDPATT